MGCLLKHEVNIHFAVCICALCYNLKAFIKIQIKNVSQPEILKIPALSGFCCVSQSSVFTSISEKVTPHNYGNSTVRMFSKLSTEQSINGYYYLCKRRSYIQGGHQNVYTKWLCQVLE